MCSSLARRLFVLVVVCFLSAVTAFAAGPMLELPGTITTEARSAVGAVVVYRVTSDGVVVGDDDDGRGTTALCTPRSGSTFSIGSTTVNCLAQNESGETTTGAFLVNVVDTTPPELFLPQVISVDSTGSSEVVTWTESAVDLVDGNVAVVCSPPSGSTFTSGVTIVSCSATDAHGNSASDSFEVHVAGTTPPVLTLPDEIVEATGPTGAYFVYDFSESVDNISCTPPSNSLFPFGVTTVNCTMDTLSDSFTVTVVDTTPPALTLPAAITAEATSPAGAVVTFTATADDVVDSSVPIVCTPPSGSTFAFGTTTVMCSATDTHGNTSTGSFTVTVVDTTPPVFVSLTATPAILWPPNKKMVAVTITPNVTDAGDPAPAVWIYNVTANEPVTSADIVMTGPLSLNLRADRAGNGPGRTYTIYVEAIDASGNRSTSTVTVKVPHDQSGKMRI